MGTRADFYIGRGIEAEWLGSQAWDGYPEAVIPDLQQMALAAGGLTTEAGFRSTITAYLATRDDATLPEHGWPWPWDTSATTDRAYCFDGGIIWTTMGYPMEQWFDVRALMAPGGVDEDGEPTGTPDPAAVVWPDMSARKNVTMGARSGLMVIGVHGPIPAAQIDAEEAGR